MENKQLEDRFCGRVGVMVNQWENKPCVECGHDHTPIESNSKLSPEEQKVEKTLIALYLAVPKKVADDVATNVRAGIKMAYERGHSDGQEVEQAFNITMAKLGIETEREACAKAATDAIRARGEIDE